MTGSTSEPNCYRNSNNTNFLPLGEQYVSGRSIRKLLHSSAALLMGCSSGRLADKGSYEPWGAPLSFLMGGSPFAIANLWDVTDKDIDRFSRSIIEKWLSANRLSGVNLGSEMNRIAESRQVCKLQHLIGASPVCYGIPTSGINLLES